MAAVLIGFVFLGPASAACLYYLTLTTLGWHGRRRPAPNANPRHTFTVVIPAHNEEAGITSAVRSVLAADYPASMVRAIVVADNCTDQTAAVARAAGADCLERTDLERRGKGYALALAVPHALAGGADAVVILDADCELPPNALRAFDATLSGGADAVQAARVPRNPKDGPAALVSAVGSAIENAVSAGKCRLGGSAALRGSGMAFTRRLLEQRPWQAYGLTEDAEYGATLTAAGVRVAFMPEVEFPGEVPADAATLAKQRTRWRAALYDRGPSLLARWLASKPLVLAQLMATVAVVGTLTPWLASEWTVAFAAWATLLVGLTGVIYVRAMQRVGGVRLREVLTAAGVAARLAWVTLAGAKDRGRAWERTRRAAEASSA